MIRQNDKCDRNVSFYGYVRGCPMKMKADVHIPGCGDFQINNISFLADPCPLPNKEKKRTLDDREKLIYAPLSGFGGIVYDKDAVYIELGQSQSLQKRKRENDDNENSSSTQAVSNNKYIDSIIKTKDTLDTKLMNTKINLFSSNVEFHFDENKISKPDKNETESDTESKDEDNDDEVLRYKKNNNADLDLFSIRKPLKINEDIDNTKYLTKMITVDDDSAKTDYMDSIRDCFVTGKWEANEEENEYDGDEFGDFDDDFDDDDLDGSMKNGNENTEFSDSEIESSSNDKSNRKKRKIWEIEENENAHYDMLEREAQEQTERNRLEFEKMDDSVRVTYEGFRSGMYVRIEINKVPSEFIKEFDGKRLMIIGGLAINESNIGSVQTRIKKHRWFGKLLKTNDPLIVSLGWRRFQTIPIYFIQDHNMRNRFLKYTPQHMHCHASFWGNVIKYFSVFLNSFNLY
jgi:ribosome biogenesis protein BMS1